MTAILYDLLYAIPLSLIAVIAGKPYFVSPEKNLPVYFVTLAALGICTAIRHWENRLKYGIPGVIIALGAGVILIQGPEKRGEFLYASQWILWTALAAIGCYVAGCLVARIRILRRVTAAGLLIALLLLMFFYYWPEKMVVAASFMVIALVVADELQRTWEKSGYVDGKGHLVSIAPFIAGLCFLVFLIPAPTQPYDWGFAVRLWNRATEYVKLTVRWIHSNDEDYGELGFSEDGKFRGNLSKSDKEVLELKSGKDAGKIVYLTGKIMDTFDGRKWTAQYEASNRDRMLDALETASAVMKYDPEYVRNYVWRVDLKLKFKEFNTKYYFMPSKTILSAEQLGGETYVTRGGDVISEENLGYGTEYTVTFLRLNMRHEGFWTFLEKAVEPDEETWDGLRYQYEARNGDGSARDGTTYADYLEYRKRMKATYLPDTPVSEATEEFLSKLFNGADSDLEKLRRLEVLLSSFQYDLSPGKLPDEVESVEDFLDYFLLKTQKGYCSHFATAFVLIARSQGIPARFVQGFYVPRDGQGTITVKSSMAHTWPEVYLEGIGWIPFEPTPEKASMETWAFAKKPEEILSGSGGNDWHVGEELADPDLLLDPEEEEEGVVIQWKVILIPLGLVLIFLFAFLLIDCLLVLAWRRKLSDVQRFKLACKKNWRVLAYLGFSANEGETLEEFAARVSQEISEDSLTFLGDQELVAYAGKLPTAEMRERAEEDLGELMELLKEAKGRWYFLYRYRIFRMETGKKLN